MKNLLLLLCLAGPVLAQNRVLELDGQESYVQLPGHIFDHLEEATVEAWVKWEEWAYFSQWFAFGTIVYGAPPGTAPVPWRGMGMNHFDVISVLQFFIYDHQGKLHVLPLVADLPLGQWCHMAAVSGRDGMRVYLNGMQVGQNGYEGSFAAIGPGVDNYLGKSNWEGNAYFRGQLDEVRVWSVARSGEQIRGGMGQRLRGDEEGLVSLWNFDGGDAREVSPQGHAGQLMGGARCVAAPFPGTGAVVQPALVAGIVCDEFGVPLADAAVRLSKGEAEGVNMTTGPDGRYMLGVFDAGTYALEVGLENAGSQWALEEARPGMADLLRREVRLQEGEILHLDLSTPSSQVAWWRGEGDEQDEVGHHDGTLVGGTNFAPGLVGQAFSLDGVDDCVRVAHAPDLELTGSFSIVVWIFPTQDTDQAIVSRWPYPREYLLSILPGLKLVFRISDDAHQEDGLFHYFASPANVLTLNTWNHVAGVYEQATGTRHLYVNGREVAKRQDLPVTVSTGREDLHIGTLFSNPETPPNDLFKGLIAEVAIYHRDLTEGEIQRLYGASARGRWPGEGNAKDASRVGNDGSLREGATFAPGVVGQAFAFDGEGSYVEFNSLIGNYGTADFTLEGWLWRDRARETREPILVKYLNEDHALDLYLDAAGRLQVELTSVNEINHFASTRPLSVRTWHHWALVRQEREVRLYVDGRLDTLKATERVVDLAVPAPLTVGGSPAQDRYFAGLIDDLSAIFRVRCQQKGLSWRVEQEGDAWQVHGDENKLRQVLVNLLGNAVKFTQAGEVGLQVRGADGVYHFAVHDTGPGIDPGQQALLFEPFQQGTAGMDQGGTGLGLAIARRHVELMGGQLQVDSAAEEGTRFFFALSLEPSRRPVVDASETRYGRVVRLADGYAPRVLIVDDVATNREILGQILEGIGAQVRQVDSGAAGLEAVARERPDLVFLDIRMPEMDGVETLQRLRQEHGELPVVAVSASVLAHEKQDYLRAGFAGYIDKPFQVEALYACLEQVLGVAYRYAAAEEEEEGVGVPVALPAELVEGLREAARFYRVTELRRYVEEVEELGEGGRSLARRLRPLVQAYDMDGVIALLDETEAS